jgi:hypothetical protein
MRGQEVNRESMGYERIFDLELQLVSEARAREGDAPGRVTVEHRVTRADFGVDMSGWPEPMQGELETVLSERESSFLRAVIRETLDAQGRRVGSEIRIPGVPPNAVPGGELAATSLMLPPADTGGQPLTAGTTWTEVSHIPSLPGVPISATSTLDHVEEIDGERVAVIRSEVTLHFDAAAEDPIELGVESDHRGTGVFVLRRLEFTFRGEDRHRLTDGRRIFTTGHVEAAGQTEILVTWRGGKRDVIETSFEESLDVVTQIEYPS